MTRRKIPKSNTEELSPEEKLQRAIRAYRDAKAAGAAPTLRQVAKKYDVLWTKLRNRINRNAQSREAYAAQRQCAL
jgi:hypothetical protein